MEVPPTSLCLGPAMRLFRHVIVLSVVLSSRLNSQSSPGPAAANTAPTAPVVRPRLPYDSLAFGRQLTQWLIAGEADSLWEHSTLSLHVQWGEEDRWKGIVETFKAQLGRGTIQRVDERWTIRGGKRQYWFVATVPGITPEPYAIRWILEPGGVGGMGLMPYSQAGPSDPN